MDVPIHFFFKIYVQIRFEKVLIPTGRVAPVHPTFKSHSPATVMFFVSKAVLKVGASVDTSQVYAPDAKGVS